MPPRTPHFVRLCLYATSYQIAKQKKSHSIGEKLIMPVMKDAVKIMVGERESKILD